MVFMMVSDYYMIWGLPFMGVPQVMGWFMKENDIYKRMIQRSPYFRKPPKVVGRKTRGTSSSPPFSMGIFSLNKPFGGDR